MQGAFTTFFGLGFDHILDVAALDHLLYLLVIGVGYTMGNWKMMGKMVTAFTLGHSLTLVAITMGWFDLRGQLVEALIPLTIVGAAVARMVKPITDAKGSTLILTTIVIFGFIHGMGFGGTLRTMLAGAPSVTVPLLGFNLGVEMGQLIVVTVLLCLNEIALRTGARRSLLIRVVCAVAAIWGIVLFFERIL